MTALNATLPYRFGILFEAVLYLGILTLVFRKKDAQQISRWLLGLYAFMGLLFRGSYTLWRADIFHGMDSSIAAQLAGYGIFIQAFLLLLLARAFVRKENSEVWMSIGLLWMTLLVLVENNVFNLPETLWTTRAWTLSESNATFGLLLLGWSVFLVSAAVNLLRAYKQATQHLHRNRLSYWLPAFAILISADALYFLNRPTWGEPLALVGAGFLTYIVLTHHLPDVRQILRNLLVYVITTLLILLFYVAGFTASQYALQAAPGYNPLLLGASITIVLAILFAPLLGAVSRVVDRWLNIEKHDAGSTLREYSNSISNILDMQRLASVAIGLIMETMDLRRGFLFLVDEEKDKNGDLHAYRIRAVRNEGERPIQFGRFSPDSPIVKALLQEQSPLLQYDIDLLPAFQGTPPEERAWLNRLEVEVYVPIFSKRKWIGLFALGSKLSGNRYTKEDLVTLSALAGQTAVALENARLVENLVRLNEEVRDAYHELNKAKSDLERLDRTKSDFISIASHELRTPLTVMRGYTEMLLENPSLDEGIRQMLKGIHEGTLRLHEIMDSMFDIAQIDARTLELHLQPVDIADLIHGVCSSLSKSIYERKQTLVIDLPALPTLRADPNTLRKVFYHLVTNAIKFTPNNGRITITGRTLPKKMEGYPDGGIELIVSDTGVGVDPAFREIIFSKFYQPSEQLGKHSTGKTKFKGSGAGLGLALSRGIVEAHGGKIWVESPGYDEIHFPGSDFHVLLPIRKSKEDDTLPFSKKLTVQI